MAQNAGMTGYSVKVDPLASYRFPMGSRVIVMDISVEYQKKDG